MTSNATSKAHHPPHRLAGTHQTRGAARDEVLRRRSQSAWIAGGALWVSAGLLYADSGWRFRSSSATWLAADVLLAAGIVAMLLLRPHGSSRPAHAALGVALGARVLFSIAEVSGLITGTEDTLLLPIAGLLTAVSTIAYGVLARCADRRIRAATIALGMYFFVVMLPVAVATGEPPALALAAWGVPAAFVGLALHRSTAPNPTIAGEAHIQRSR